MTTLDEKNNEHYKSRQRTNDSFTCTFLMFDSIGQKYNRNVKLEFYEIKNTQNKTKYKRFFVYEYYIDVKVHT